MSDSSDILLCAVYQLCQQSMDKSEDTRGIGVGMQRQRPVKPGKQTNPEQMRCNQGYKGHFVLKGRLLYIYFLYCTSGHIGLFLLGTVPRFYQVTPTARTPFYTCKTPGHLGEKVPALIPKAREPVYESPMEAAG